MNNQDWNSLEVAKLVASCIAPLVVVVVGYWIRSAILRLEQRQWSNQAIIEWRVRVYDDLAPILNSVYCFCTYKGSWKEFDPAQMIALKRDADRRFHLAAPLFSGVFSKQYHEFISVCFRMYTGKGASARIKANIEMHRQGRGALWKSEWDDLFVSPAERSERQDVENAYQLLMAAFSTELGLGLRTNTGGKSA